MNLAATMNALGDFSGAKGLGEEVLAVFTRTLAAEHPDLQEARKGLAATKHAHVELLDAGARIPDLHQLKRLAFVYTFEER